MAQARQGKDAIALLKEDHKKVKGLLAQLEKTTERGAERRKKLLAQIETEVKVHTTIEEEIFYPAYRDAVKKKDDRELYQEALEEHHVVDLVMPELKDVAAWHSIGQRRSPDELGRTAERVFPDSFFGDYSS